MGHRCSRESVGFLGNLDRAQLIAANTFYQKADVKLVTYKEMNVEGDPPYTGGRHETLDYVIIKKNWKGGHERY